MTCLKYVKQKVPKKCSTINVLHLSPKKKHKLKAPLTYWYSDKIPSMLYNWFRLSFFFHSFKREKKLYFLFTNLTAEHKFSTYLMMKYYKYLRMLNIKNWKFGSFLYIMLELELERLHSYNKLFYLFGLQSMKWGLRYAILTRG